MATDAKKRDPDQDKPQDGPTFDEVVRKMLNTPPKPKPNKRVNKVSSAKRAARP